MRTSTVASTVCIGLATAVLFTQCQQHEESKKGLTLTAGATYNGFESRVKFGEHLVTIGACHDCHTPKKMTAFGPDIDSALLLSGHPANEPAPVVDRKDIESKGLSVTGTLTSWVGPWGISYAANLTSDSTGTGNWSEQQFMNAIRHGKFKGLDAGRDLLPPMPWQMYRNMTDDELKAIFAYLKTTKPIKNVVPAPVPPVAAGVKE